MVSEAGCIVLAIYEKPVEFLAEEPAAGALKSDALPSCHPERVCNGVEGPRRSPKDDRW